MIRGKLALFAGLVLMLATWGCEFGEGEVPGAPASEAGTPTFLGGEAGEPSEAGDQGQEEEEAVGELESYVGLMPDPAQPASIEFLSPSSDCANPVVLQVLANGPVHKVVYRADGFKLGESKNPGDYFKTTYVFSGGGLRTVKAEAIDEFGQVLATAQRVTVVHNPGDTGTVSFVSPTEHALNPVEMKVSTSGPVKWVNYYVDGTSLAMSDNSASGFSASHKFWTDGWKVLEVRAYGHSGQLLDTDIRVAYVGPASISFSSPGATTGNPVLIALNAAGPIAHVDYYSDGQKIGSSSLANTPFGIVHTFAQMGNHAIEAKAYNSAGQKIAGASTVTKVESEATLKITSPKAGSGNPVSMTVSTTGAISQVRYYCDDWHLGTSTNGADGFKVTHTFSQTGTRTIKAYGYNSWSQLLAEDSVTTFIAQDFSLQFTSPTGSTAANPVTFKVGHSGALGKVEYLAEGQYSIGTSWNPDGHFKIEYKFNALGVRTVVARGYYNGEVVAEDEITFSVTAGDGGYSCPAGKIEDCNGNCAKEAWLDDDYCDNGIEFEADYYCEAFDFDGGDCDQSGTPTNPPVSGGLPDVPYFYQYANSYSPGASCQNTSLAMVLKYYGWNGVPDDITYKWGKNYAQSVAGLATVFNSYADDIGIPQRIVGHQDGTLTDVDNLLVQGKPVIVHGYFTSYGHVLVLVGKEGSDYVVNDPAGKWNQAFKGGYPYGWNSTIGDHIHYSAAALTKAIATWDGATPAPIWYHEITQ